MKKSLLALAVLGAFAGAANAQTNVTIYGVADAGIQRTDTSATSATWSLNSGLQSGSRIGFKGTEDLGGGLSAIFTLENGFNIDDGSLALTGATLTSPAATRLFGRQAWVGLQGGFGSVKLGRQETPLYLAATAIDPFATGLAGNMSNVFGGGGYVNAQRMDNSITYTLPGNLGGFTGTVGYGLGETAGSTSDNAQVALGLGYANGPLNVQFAYHNVNATTAATDVDTRSAFLGATYDFRVVKAHVAFADSRVSTDVPAGVADVKNRNWMLGLTAPVGAAGTVMATWVRNDLRNVANADTDLLAIGYSHALSKRTNFYTSYGRFNNDGSASLISGRAGVDASRFNVGVRHRF